MPVIPICESDLCYPVQTNLTLKKFYLSGYAWYKLWKDRFVVFSPEIFVRIEDGLSILIR